MIFKICIDFLKKSAQVRLAYFLTVKESENTEVQETKPESPLCSSLSCVHVCTYIPIWCIFTGCFFFNPNETLCFCDIHFSFNSEHLESFPCSYS